MTSKACFVAAGLTFMWAPLSAAAFELLTTQSGAPLHWSKNATIAYEVQFELGSPEGEAFSAAARRGLDHWTQEGGAWVHLEYRGPVRAATFGDGHSTVALARSLSHPDLDRVVALTLHSYDTSTGELSESDISLNAVTFLFADATPGAFDTESVVLHESGHLLGLAHTCGDRSGRYPSCFSLPEVPQWQREQILGAVMAPTLATGVQRRALNADDGAALTALYPGERTGAWPRLTAVERPCPGTWIWVRGEIPKDARASLRFSSGTSVEAPIARRDPAGIAIEAAFLGQGQTVDLQVFADANPRARQATWVDLPRTPPDCAPPAPDPEPDGGCRAAGGPGQAGWLVWLLGALFLRPRDRRCRA